MYIPLHARRVPDLLARDAGSWALPGPGPWAAQMQHLATVPDALKRRQVSISANNDNTNRTVGIVLGVLLGVFVIGVCVFLYVYRDALRKARHRRRRRRRHHRRPGSKSSKSSSEGAPPPPPPAPPADAAPAPAAA
ncbi:hypothetical protein D7B24_001788 [Verticillium nonalfalfae]|uniref:Uncharacterized protein n=1 Tax=Verticillium nonalfalfae TaxID=1051616 RepID=A0A3M9YGB7_9PEZI|nr:uncharacterized protein D7B24_001788 [Verticillium nonalfalfae]RNJ59613.1 hypothetical protein D7B24_001788 [Verticillium nonalfalfae]